MSTHQGLDEDQRLILEDVFAASETSLKEVMRPRGDVSFLRSDLPLAEAAARIHGLPYSRYPVTGAAFDDVLGFLHVRDLLDVWASDQRVVRDVDATSSPSRGPTVRCPR